MMWSHREDLHQTMELEMDDSSTNTDPRNASENSVVSSDGESYK